MLLNEHVAVSTSKVLLVPYSVHHVPVYHEWMKDPDLQLATASEPLTLEEEYVMQQNWRDDADKLTFIICTPDSFPSKSRSGQLDLKTMIGDVNMFLSVEEDDEGKSNIVGELELMIAKSPEQRKGYGRSSILTALRYVMEHDRGVLLEYQLGKTLDVQSVGFSYFAVKIGQENARSISLFESLGFKKINLKPNYFGEFELRHHDLTVKEVERLMHEHHIEDYRELEYHDSPTV